MAQSVYSFLGSPLHLVLEDDIAEGYNRHVDSFLDAQVEHEKRYGRKWNPNEPLRMRTKKGDNEAYNKVAGIINYLVEINDGGLEISEELITSDYLEKVSDLDFPERGRMGRPARFDMDYEFESKKTPLRFTSSGKRKR